MKKALRSAALLAFVLLAGASAAFAQAQPALPPFMAYPSLWHIKADQGEVYMLGAVYVLPANVHWRTPQISHALARSDVFVFEVPEDAKSMQELAGMIQARGYLPPDQSLRAHGAAGIRAEVLEAGVFDVQHDSGLRVGRGRDRADGANFDAVDLDVLAGDDVAGVVEDRADRVAAVGATRRGGQ